MSSKIKGAALNYNLHIGKPGLNNNVLEYGYDRVSWLKGIEKLKAGYFFW